MCPAAAGHDPRGGIATDLCLGVPAVKTYRNRAFARLGIHFRNELFARVLGD